MKKLIAFNWKMNPASKKEAGDLLKIYLKTLTAKPYTLNAYFIVCPPFVYLSKIATSINRSRIKLGSQDIFWEESGAYTGEISPAMLKDLGVEYAIIGHSERRQYMGETDEMINKKIKAALLAGLKVILCVGETLLIRKKGKKEVENFIKKQLVSDLKDLKNASSFKLQASNLVVAYEPIWAIGTGVPCAPKDAQETIGFIKSFVASSLKLQDLIVLYGGSVNSQNVKSFVQLKGIDGALVGGASLKKEEVEKIINQLK